MKTTHPKRKHNIKAKAYNHYWLNPTNVKPAPDPSDDSEPEDDEYDDLEQGGFFGDFCLGCGERCIGGDAYCSIYCHVDAVRTSAAPKQLPVPVFPTSDSYGCPNAVPTFQVSETYAYLFPIVFVAPDPPSDEVEEVACSPPKQLCSVASSSSFSLSSSDASLSGSASSVADSPIDHVRFAASRPPPSPSIKATLAGPSLSPPIAVRPAGTGGHAALALRQALGISALAPLEPLRRASEPVSSNWLKLLVAGRKDRQETLVKSPSSGSVKSLSI